MRNRLKAHSTLYWAKPATSVPWDWMPSSGLYMHIYAYTHTDTQIKILLKINNWHQGLSLHREN